VSFFPLVSHLSRWLVGCQSTRHMTNSSKSQLITVNPSHDELVTRSSHHIV